MSIDILSSDQPGWPPPPQVRRGRATMLTALTAVGSLVLVAGAATVAFRAFNHTTDPASLVPASAFAYAQVDLDLPGGQAAALRTLADRFPDSPTHHGAGDARDRLLRAVFRASNNPHVDYDTQIRPWVGDRAAVAGWMDTSGHPQAEFLVQVRNGATGQHQVEQLMRQTQDSAAVRFHDGYAVFADSTRLADAAIAAATRSSLADDTTFRSDLAALAGPRVLVAWADGDGVRRALRAAIGPAFDQALGRMSAFGLGSSLFRGRAAADVRLASDYVQVDVRSVGQRAMKTASSSLLTGLPSGTLGALEIGDPSTVVTGLASTLSAAFAFAVPHTVTVYGQAQGAVAVPRAGASISGSPAMPSVVGGPAQPSTGLSAPMPPQAGTATPRPGVTCTPPACASMVVAPPVRVVPQNLTPPNPLTEIRRYTGLSFPGDVRTLLGDGAVVSYGGLRLGGLPRLALVTHPRDLTAARTLADRLSAAIGARTPLRPAVETSGGRLVIATTADYAAAVRAGGAFGADPQVRLALGDVPSAVTAAGYLDLSSLWPFAGPHVPRDLTHVHAVGFWATSSGAVQRFQLRVVIG